MLLNVLSLSIGVLCFGLSPRAYSQVNFGTKSAEALNASVLVVDRDFTSGSHGGTIVKWLESKRLRVGKLKLAPLSKLGNVTRALRSASWRSFDRILVPMGFDFPCPELLRDLGVDREDFGKWFVSLGVGIANPFQPQPVSSLCPQGVMGVQLVGVKVSDPESLNMQNQVESGSRVLWVESNKILPPLSGSSGAATLAVWESLKNLQIKIR